MPETPNLKLVYPAEGQADYYIIMKNLFDRMDILLASGARNAMGAFGITPSGQAWTFDTGTGVLVTQPLIVVRAYDGDTQLLAAATLTVTTNQKVYIDWSTMSLVASSTVPADNTTLVLVRDDSTGSPVIVVNPMLNIQVM